MDLPVKKMVMFHSYVDLQEGTEDWREFHELRVAFRYVALFFLFSWRYSMRAADVFCLEALCHHQPVMMQHEDVIMN